MTLHTGFWNYKLCILNAFAIEEISSLKNNFLILDVTLDLEKQNTDIKTFSNIFLKEIEKPSLLSSTYTKTWHHLPCLFNLLTQHIFSI